MLPQGLLPLSTFADNLGTIAYTDFQLATAAGQAAERAAQNLGDCNVLLIRNNGGVTVGRTDCAECFFLMDNLHKAADVQVDACALAAGTGQHC